jgi:hypothetical protein
LENRIQAAGEILPLVVHRYYDRKDRHIDFILALKRFRWHVILNATGCQLAAASMNLWALLIYGFLKNEGNFSLII